MIFIILIPRIFPTFPDISRLILTFPDLSRRVGGCREDVRDTFWWGTYKGDTLTFSQSDSTSWPQSVATEVDLF